MKWETTIISTSDGDVESIAPLIISASRSTDIPAFHAEWFMRRLRAGYVKWINPFNQKPQFVSFSNARAIVFWTKNPEPLLPFLPELDERGIPYYFQFTVNDYDAERLEPHVPGLDRRIAVFHELANRIGEHRVIWRFDPLILAAGLESGSLLSKVRRVGDQLHAHTTKLIFSFADISSYAKVSRNLRAAGIPYRDFEPDEMIETGRAIGDLCRDWRIVPVTCGEGIDLAAYGVEKNKCVDDELLLEITHDDPALASLFGYSLSSQMNLFDCSGTSRRKNIKDPGQRKECGCVFSKDIGQYNTCPHLCAYCYANTSAATVKRNLEDSNVDGESIVSRDS